jgi:Protein of unknown function (DUF1571)
MTTDQAAADEFERIRGACADLGADEEMTKLVLASHRHDRTPLDVMVANGDDLRDYVQYKLAIWEAIFNDDEEPLPSRSPSRSSSCAEHVLSLRDTPDRLAGNPPLRSRPLGPRSGSESLMSIPMNRFGHPVNPSTKRGRRWLSLGLLGAVVVTGTTWEPVRKRASSPAGLTDVRGPSLRAAESLAAGGRSVQYERDSDSGVAVAALNPDRADAGSVESRVALKPVAGARGGADSHEVERGTPIASALARIERCKLRYRTVRDYTCTFSKRERIKGQLTPLHVIMMKVRTEPRSIYLKFRQPTPGREAIYIAGRNNGKVLVHDVGLNKLLAGTLRLEPTGGRAMEECRHPISEAGIGPLLDTLKARWSSELAPSESVVVFREKQTVGTRRCTMIEATHPHQQPEFMFYRVRLFIDDALGLPIHFEAYDWPSAPLAPAEMVEEYTYSDLRLNVGLSDIDFNVSNTNYAFGRF